MMDLMVLLKLERHVGFKYLPGRDIRLQALSNTACAALFGVCDLSLSSIVLKTCLNCLLLLVACYSFLFAFYLFLFSTKFTVPVFADG